MAAIVGASTISGSCRANIQGTATPSAAVLRVGVALLSASNPTAGIRQLTQNLSVEGLARLAKDGRVEPWLADRWRIAEDGRSLVVTLKSGVKFHDGSPVTAQTVVALLPDALRTSTLGRVFEDVDRVRVVDFNSIEIGFRRPSPFLLESLEVPIRKPGASVVGTGTFMAVANSTTDLHANEHYYLGAPRINHIHIETFPSVRTAWAELLRNRIDMLYDVGPDALDSLQSAKGVATFTYVRHYQYVLALNTELPALKSREIRRALNMAVDREDLVRRALGEHGGVPSTGPIWPQYWASQEGLPTIQFDPQHAAETLGPKHLQFTCLLPPDQVYERIALELKRQFAAVGVDMSVRAVSQNEMFDLEKNRRFDAVLIDGISAPTLLRVYQLWHSGGAVNPGTFGNATVDAAFDRVRRAENETDYRQAVADLHRAFNDDPPGIFLAWSERARAVSKRFLVPASEPGRDVLGTIRLWTPRDDERFSNRN